MFCPKCGSEYKDDIAICTICNTPLENKLSHLGTSERIKLVTIHKTSDPIFISLVKSILEAENIPHYFKGEGLQDLYLGSRFGIGNSILFGPVEIQVDEKDAQNGKEILKQIEQGKFEMPEDEGNNKDMETPELEVNTANKYSFKGIFSGLIIGILVTSAIIYIYNAVQSYRQKNLSWTYEDDTNKDGKKDQYFYYEKGVLARTEGDQNFDGKTDFKCLYKVGIVDYCEVDENYDGTFEAKYYYQKGLQHRVEFYFNQNKNPDIIDNYINGIIYDSVYYHETTRKIWKKVFYRYDIINEEQIDQDYDGALDVVIKYNESGRPIKTIKLKK